MRTLNAGSSTRDPSLEETLSTLAVHDHACLIFDSQEEQLRANSSFVRLGQEVGDRCMCVADSGNVHEIEEDLRRSGLDVDGATARGALTITTERGAYLAHGPFDPDAMLRVVRDISLAAVRDGFRALRIAGEVTWALGGDLGSERIMEYEERVNTIMPTLPCLSLCHYDRRRFSAEVLRDVIRTHPLAVVNGRLCRNFYYVPPGELVGPDRLHHEVDRLLENIYEREVAEEALRTSERRLALVLEGASEAFWDWDLRTGEIAFGPRWAAAVGLVKEEPRDSVAAWRRHIHPEDLPAAIAGIEAHLAGRAQAYAQEYRVRFADGAWRWVLSRGRVVERDRSGRPTRMAGMMSDVTEKRAMQARLELSSRLASAGTLASGVAHEINNPLTVVDSNLRWVVEQLGTDPATPPEIRSALTEALDGGERVRDIVQNLQRLARPAPDSARSTAAVNDELEAVLGMVRRQVETRARLTATIEPGLPAVRVSRHELGQVVVNLLVNAAQAVPEGRAGANEVHLAARRDEQGLAIEVSDTGQGIPPETLPHVFDPFFTTKPVGSGTGLGLAICHGIVDAAGGTIAVESEPGQGTVFRICLPAAEEPMGTEREPTPVPAAPGRRILVVDDEPMVGRAVARALSGEHQVEILTSGQEALRRVEAGERWDLVLCDVVMPELAGPQLVEALLRSAPDLADRIVYMSGASAGERLEGRLCLRKPLVIAELRRAVAERCGGGERWR